MNILLKALPRRIIGDSPPNRTKLRVATRVTTAPSAEKKSLGMAMAYLSVFSGGMWADEPESKQQQGAQDTEKEKQQQAGL